MTTKYPTGLALIYNAIQSELPGLSAEHLKQVVHDTTNKFLETSCVWREVLTPTITSAGEATLFPPECTVLVHYRKPEWKGDLSQKPTSFKASTPYEIILDPVPIAPVVGDLEVTVILKMATASDKVPDYILDTHYEVLRLGAMARLMLEPNKPYTNGDIGLAYTRQTTLETSKARDMAERMYGRNESSWTFPTWA